MNKDTTDWKAVAERKGWIASQATVRCQELLEEINVLRERVAFLEGSIAAAHELIGGNLEMAGSALPGARLAAAAPDLLEALKGMIAWRHDLSESTIRIAMDAVAKATGGQGR